MFKQIHSLKILGQLEFEATRSQFVFLNFIYLLELFRQLREDLEWVNWQQVVKIEKLATFCETQLGCSFILSLQRITFANWKNLRLFLNVKTLNIYSITEPASGLISQAKTWYLLAAMVV